MRYKAGVILAVCSVILAGCQDKFVHYDLPDNVLDFPSEGGVVEYNTSEKYNLELESIQISGKEVIVSPIFESDVFIGYESEWVRFIYGRYNGKGQYLYIIETRPNNESSPRSAKIQVRVSAKLFGEFLVNQCGQEYRHADTQKQRY